MCARTTTSQSHDDVDCDVMEGGTAAPTASAAVTAVCNVVEGGCNVGEGGCVEDGDRNWPACAWAEWSAWP